jgi:hypothetical protein
MRLKIYQSRGYSQIFYSFKKELLLKVIILTKSKFDNYNIILIVYE